MSYVVALVSFLSFFFGSVHNDALHKERIVNVPQADVCRDGSCVK